jgi:hypothetical protein
MVRNTKGRANRRFRADTHSTHVELAVCILTVDTPVNFDIWKEWAGDALLSGQCRMFINAKSAAPLHNGAEAYRLPEDREVRKTGWGDASLARAACALFKSASEHNPKWTVFVSGDTIPLRTYEHTMNLLSRGNRSIFSKFARMVPDQKTRRDIGAFFALTAAALPQKKFDKNFWCKMLHAKKDGTYVELDISPIDWASQFMVLNTHDVEVLGNIPTNVFDDAHDLMETWWRKVVKVSKRGPDDSPCMAPDEFIPLTYLHWHNAQQHEPAYSYDDKPIVWSTLMVEAGENHARTLFLNRKRAALHPTLIAYVNSDNALFARKLPRYTVLEWKSALDAMGWL